MKKPQRQDRRDLDAWIAHEIGAHDAADRARRANHRYLRVRLDPDLRERPRDAAHEIKTRKRGRVIESSMLLPKSQRNHMFPIRCVQPP